MSDGQPIQSILAADIGSTTTRVCLIDIVEGTWRLVALADAPTTLTEDTQGVCVGLRSAIQQVETIIQRPLLDDAGGLVTPERETGAGVDALVVTSSAAPPLRCAIVALTDDLSLASAQRACGAANVLVSRCILADTRGGGWTSEVTAALVEQPPDLLVIVGGTDGGPIAPLESAARVLSILYADVDADARPAIVFAGNQEGRRPLSGILSPLFEFRVVNNVRPSIQVESLGELQRELLEAYERHKLARLPGHAILRQWSAVPIMSTVRALGHIAQFLARRGVAQGVLALDVGSACTTVAIARGEEYRWAVRPQVGIGEGIGGVIASSGLDAIVRWLPPGLDSDEAWSRLENARLRPRSVPQTQEDQLLTLAVLREAVSAVLERFISDSPSPDGQPAPPPGGYDLLMARGGALAQGDPPAAAVLALLDALQPTGLCRVVVDWASMWPQLGALAAISPLAAAQVLDRDALRDLGTVIAPKGSARRGTRAIRLSITYEDGRKERLDIPAGAVQRFPLPPGESAVIEARPTRQFDIGLGRSGMGGRTRVRGGILGIVVDTRGRPLALAPNAHQRQVNAQEWLRSLGFDVECTA